MSLLNHSGFKVDIIYLPDLADDLADEYDNVQHNRAISTLYR